MQLVNKQEDLGDFSDEQIGKGNLFELEGTPVKIGRDSSYLCIHSMNPNTPWLPRMETVVDLPLLAKSGSL